MFNTTTTSTLSSPSNFAYSTHQRSLKPVDPFGLLTGLLGIEPAPADLPMASLVRSHHTEAGGISISREFRASEVEGAGGLELLVQWYEGK